MATTTAYSFKSVSAVLDGQQVQGLWEGDDAISVAPAADTGTGLIGADGSGIFSISSNKAATITLRLQHTSPTHRILMQKLERQDALGGIGAAFPFNVVETVTGEGGSSDQCLIAVRPTVQNGQNATSREWTLWTAEWKMEIPNG